MRTGQSGQSATSPAAQFPEAASSAVTTPVPSLPALPKPPRHRARSGRLVPTERARRSSRPREGISSGQSSLNNDGRGAEMHRRPRNVRGRVGPWVREHMRPWVGSWAPRGPRLAASERDAREPRRPAGRARPAAVAWAVGRVAEECRRRHVARCTKRPLNFPVPLVAAERRGVAAGSRGAPQRACALYLAAMHTVSACLALGSARRAPGNRG